MKKNKEKPQKDLWSRTVDHTKENFIIYLVCGITILLCLVTLLNIGEIEQKTEQKYKDYINRCMKNKNPELDLLQDLESMNITYQSLGDLNNYE